MTPLDFITECDQYNTPAGDWLEALSKQLIIRSSNSEWEILSYYLTEYGMCLDIQKKKEKKE